MIGVKNFTVISEAEEGNIFEAEVTMNAPAALDAAAAPPEAEDSENEEANASIFDAILTIQPGRGALTSNDLVDLRAHALEIDNNNQPVPENAENPDELEDVGEWIEL